MRLQTGAGVKNLNEQVREWPTPAATPYGNNQGGAAGRVGPKRESLERMVWPTPKAENWPTATTRDWKDGACADANVPTNGLLGRAVPRTTGSSRARLNPRWVAQLMGYPHDWLAPDGEAS
jgi:hypothetical protein